MERVLAGHAHGAVGLVGGPRPRHRSVVGDDLGRRNLQIARSPLECAYCEVGRHGELRCALRHRDQMLLHCLKPRDGLTELAAFVRVVDGQLGHGLGGAGHEQDAAEGAASA